MQQIEITVDRRIRTGGNVARRLRRSGKVPGIVYGLEKQAVPVEIDGKTFSMKLGAAGDNAIFLLRMQGTDVTRHAIVKDLQLDPVKNTLLHVDFQRIDLTKRIEVEVPVHCIGTPAGIKEGGALEFVHREIRVECLPTDIPQFVEVDVAGLHIGQAVRVADAKMPENVKVLTEAETVLAVVHAPKAEAAPVEAVVEGVTAAEPTVIAKGKEAKEGAEGAAPKAGAAPAKGGAAPAKGGAAPAKGGAAPAKKPEGKK